ncbi:ABC transporter permease, partial [bacterium]|nr:ABC transporter permease [bacterium]
MVHGNLEWTLGGLAALRRGRAAIGRLLRHRAGTAGALAVAVIVASAILAPSLAPYPDQGSGSKADMAKRLQPPSRHRWFGTDNLGRDVFSRVLFGGRVSLLISVLAILLAGTVGSA